LPDVGESPNTDRQNNKSSKVESAAEAGSLTQEDYGPSIERPGTNKPAGKELFREPTCMIGAIDWGSIALGLIIGVVCGWSLRAVFAKR